MRINLIFSKLAKFTMDHLTFGNQTLNWFNTIKYLGVYFYAGMVLKCDNTPYNCKLYAATNALLSLNSCNQLWHKGWL